MTQRPVHTLKTRASFSVCLITAVALCATAAPATAAPAAPPSAAAVATADPSAAEVRELTAALQQIEDIPDSALVSQAAWEAYQQQQSTQVTLSREGAVSCSIAITVAIGSNLFVFGKVLKIKEAIKLAGGAQKFATQAIKHYNDARAAGSTKSQAIGEASKKSASAGGEDLVIILADLFSVNGVVTDCFGVDW